MENGMERLIGEVTAVKVDRGFCFVRLDDRSSYFLHFKNIRNRVVAETGDLFTFTVRETPGRPGFVEAYDAQLVKRENIKPAVVAPEAKS